jgi:hypothetical protein
MHLLAEEFLFWEDDWGFLKKRAKTYLNVTNFFSHLPRLRPAFTSMVYKRHQNQIFWTHVRLVFRMLIRHEVHLVQSSK